ncbi:MAG: hypothetical protein PHF57_09685 [Methanoregula sp.]|jgi:hypothetical protein|nr:hypothetical protein [Methanoregula sp.]
MNTIDQMKKRVDALTPAIEESNQDGRDEQIQAAAIKIKNEIITTAYGQQIRYVDANPEDQRAYNIAWLQAHEGICSPDLDIERDVRKIYLWLWE